MTESSYFTDTNKVQYGIQSVSLFSFMKTIDIK